MNESRNPSVWVGEINALGCPRLDRDLKVDICIIGAGIAGMTTAYLLARRGRSVVVLDANCIGGGETQHTTAHLSNAMDRGYTEMIRLHGRAGARMIAESHTAAIGRIESIIDEEAIDCDFHRLDGFLFAPPGSDYMALRQESQSAQMVGLHGVEWLFETPVADYDVGPSVRFPQQGQFHPLKYLAGLRDAILRDGGQIYGGTMVERIEPGRVVYTADGQVVQAEHLVITTNTPINDRWAMHSKQATYLSYVIGAEIPAGSVRKALLWDNLHPYHYIRTAPHTPERDLLIVGGEDHRVGQADDAEARFARLERWTRERFPMTGPVHYRWSGRVVDTIDGIAFIGRNPVGDEGVLIATGDNGLGMTHGTLAGMILSEMIMGRKHRWEDLYDPSRRTVAAVGEYVWENLATAVSYADYLTPGVLPDESAIAPESGAVLRHGLKKVAVYRDAAGVCHHFSAVCPHMKCLVRWNSMDKTWDCPCHGSRFSAEGEVMQGPATENLTPEALHPAPSATPSVGSEEAPTDEDGRG